MTISFRVVDEIHFTPSTRPYTQKEIKHGCIPARDWQDLLTDPNAFAKLLRKRRLIGYGAFGAVYNVDGAAVKIGCIGESEPAIQQWVFEQHERALPVWAFAEEVILPKVVTREVCPQHGFLSNLWTRTSVNCHCDTPMAVLVMPVGNRASKNCVSDKTTLAVCDAVFEKFGFCLDVHERNFLMFNDRLMLCDFGDPNDRVVDYW